ncbi:MAG TPA: hypothetical protein VM600_05415 [Actinomycetota bacterium]|nr:hypothetical protein [Actinomycetota bacterium]
MTWIEATCPTCGPVECTPADFTLAICEDYSPATFYTFPCPMCEETVQKPAEERVVELLIAEGVRPTSWNLPAELREAHDGPAFTIDDVLDFHLAMEQPDWVERLLKTEAS